MDIYEWLVPGYVFVVTDRVGEFYQALKRVPRLTKLLGREFENGEPAFTPLGHDEEKWLAAMLGEEWFRTGSSTDGADPVAELSQVGFDENDRVVILSGPLMSFTGQVRRINLHKRYAEVEVNFMGKSQLLHLGIDVLVKAEEVERCQ